MISNIFCPVLHRCNEIITVLSSQKSKCWSHSHIWLFAIPWTVAHQATLPLEFPRQEYWSGLPFPFSKGSSWPRDQTWVSCIARGSFTIWSTKEAPIKWDSNKDMEHQGWGKLPQLVIFLWVQKPQEGDGLYLTVWSLKKHDYSNKGLPRGFSGIESTCDIRGMGLIPELGRSPRRRKW